MEISIIWIVILFFVIYIVCFIAAHAITEGFVRPFGLFDVYPWKCRKCLTTWSMAVSYGVGGLILGSWVFFLGGLLLTTAQAICFIITDKEKGL